ncbi:MAG: putative glutamine amidotransferase [Akkermansiaceae bacterium]|jgi:putative glutamine amidotransferase
MKKPSRRSFLFSIFAAVTGVLGFQIGQENPDPNTPDSPTVSRSDEAPLIGIASLVSDDYIRAVRDAGGIPLVLPNTDGSTAQIQSYLDSLDGLLLPGGADIPPSEYGEEAHETVRILDDSRFKFEKALSAAWIRQSDKPLLGICLGSQWINVASGGSLVQDIPSEFGVNHRNRNHEITLESDSRLSGILGTSQLEVNSLHHQAVGKLGDGLRIVARCPDGVVEATETTDPNRFLIGVQWHPEKLAAGDERQAKLLKAFIEAAKELKAKRAQN